MQHEEEEVHGPMHGQIFLTSILRALHCTIVSQLISALHLGEWMHAEQRLTWEPLVLGPALAMDRMPTRSRFITEFAVLPNRILKQSSLMCCCLFLEAAGGSMKLGLPGPVCFSLKFSSANFSPEAVGQLKPRDLKMQLQRPRPRCTKSYHR